MTAAAAGPSLWARRLGLCGLIPFVTLAAALWLAWPSGWPPASTALLGYGATIASFLGAIHWGLVMRDAPAQPVPSLLWGVVPSLLAWVALLVGTVPGLWLVVLGLWACFAVDRAVYPRFGLQGWLAMRLALTVVATLACAWVAWSLRP